MKHAELKDRLLQYCGMQVSWLLTCGEVGSEDISLVPKGLRPPPQHLHLLLTLPLLHVL